MAVSVENSQAAPAARLGPAPAWIAWGARAIRLLPMGRSRAVDYLCKPATPPFEAPLPGSRTGLKFLCDVRNITSRKVFFLGAYEPQEVAFVEHLLRPGGTMVDAGSHWGYFTLLAAELVGPTGRVVAIEADPEVYEDLAANVRLNGLGMVTARNQAVSGGPGVLRLVTGRTDRTLGASHVATGPTAPEESTFEVPTVGLDALLDELAIPQVDLLKLDIEGAEVFALDGMRAGLASGRYRNILFELHPEQIRKLGSTAASLADQLRSAGYRGWTIEHSPEATRRYSYRGSARPSEVVKPLETEQLDIWAHQIWVAAGQPDPF